MSDLGQRLLGAIDAAAPGGVATADEGADRVRVGVAACDTLSVAITELRLSTPRLAEADADRVRAVADRLTERVTYLLEALTPVEVDRDLAVVQMRSVQPTASAEGPSYYELLVKTGGSLSLRRYRKPRGALREPIDATLTREVLARLVSDFVEAVG
ncbi:MAG: hypothetical protein AAF805_08545 [Planctomycetota bacterium]